MAASRSFSERLASPSRFRNRKFQANASSGANLVRCAGMLLVVVSIFQVLFHSRISKFPSASLVPERIKLADWKLDAEGIGFGEVIPKDGTKEFPEVRRTRRWSVPKLVIFQHDNEWKKRSKVVSLYKRRPRIVHISEKFGEADIVSTRHHRSTTARRRMRQSVMLDSPEANPLYCDHWNSEHLLNDFYKRIQEDIPDTADVVFSKKDRDPRPSYLTDAQCRWTGPKWQMAYRPTCLPIFEMDLTDKGRNEYNFESKTSALNWFDLDPIVYHDSDEDDDFVYVPPEEEVETLAPELIKSMNQYDKLMNGTKDLEFHDWEQPTESPVAISSSGPHKAHSSLTSEYLASGNVRDVWKIFEFDGTPRVLKTLQLEQTFDHASLERHRIDAMAYEHLSSSPHVVDMYAHCANSAVFNFGTGGDLSSMFPAKFKDKPELLDSYKSQPSEDTRKDDDDSGNDSEDVVSDDEHARIKSEFENEMANNKLYLEIAYNISLALIELHQLRNLSDVVGHPVGNESTIAVMAHTDLKPDQIVFEGGSFKLTDLNRARFLGWNINSNSLCGTSIRGERQGGVWRAPEQYVAQQRADEQAASNSSSSRIDVQVNETDMSDMFSFGNILSFMLHRGHSPYPVVRAYEYTKYYVAKIAKGELAEPQVTFWDMQRRRRRRKMTNYSIYDRVAFVYGDAMELIISQCFNYDPRKRPTALKASKILREALDEIRRIDSPSG